MESQRLNKQKFFFDHYISNYMTITGSFMRILPFYCPDITTFLLVGC
jgi:hypothetical protein